MKPRQREMVSKRRVEESGGFRTQTEKFAVQKSQSRESESSPTEEPYFSFDKKTEDWYNVSRYSD